MIHILFEQLCFFLAFSCYHKPRLNRKSNHDHSGDPKQQNIRPFEGKIRQKIRQKTFFDVCDAFCHFSPFLRSWRPGDACKDVISTSIAAHVPFIGNRASISYKEDVAKTCGLHKSPTCLNFTHNSQEKLQHRSQSRVLIQPAQLSSSHFLRMTSKMQAHNPSLVSFCPAVSSGHWHFLLHILQHCHLHVI